MKLGLAAVEIESFRSVVAQRLGLNFDDARLEFLGDVARGRMEATGCGLFSLYLRRVAAGEREEIRALAEQLTVNETYFFRYADHFRAFAEVVVPARIHARGDDRRLRILSAGCSSGEEAYSLAIFIQSRLRQLASWDISIHGIDVNASMVGKAVSAKYSAWSLRETPAEIQSRYFRRDGSDFILDATVRSQVTFEERNLLEEDPRFWLSDTFDVVFCRNVTMYFTGEVASAVIARVANSTASRGFLFLGHAENLRGVSQDFHLRHTHGTFYYQRREAHDMERVTASQSPSTGGSLQSRAPASVESADSWFNIIRMASERVTDLTQTTLESTANGGESVRARASSPAASPRSRACGRTAAIELMRKERFAEAMGLLEELPAESQVDPDTQLLVAALLTNRGELQKAERVCRHVLELDELNAGAHYLMALCREHAGDRDGAREHDQAATYLDSAFALPHLHLGLLAKRTADMETARREFGRALPLLAREDASRILLFGGGFTRAALVEFCRAELRSCDAA